MLALVCYRDGGEKNGVCSIHSVRFCTVYVERGEGLRARLSAKRAAKYLKKRRVRRAVFPPEYPYEESFARFGVLPVEEAPLRMAKAGEIVRRAMETLSIRPERARVALLAEDRSDVLARTAAELSRSVRHLTLCAPGSERLARALRWDSGVSVSTADRGRQLSADLAVSFDATVPRSACPCLMLAGDSISVEYGAELPPEETNGRETRQLLAALFSVHALRAEEITIKAVKFSAKMGENANLP